LQLGPLTVRNYISRLLLKFEARNRTELLAKVITLRRYAPVLAHREGKKAPRLTEQERDILKLVFNGLTNRQIGQALYLSPLTVRNYISRLLLKFEARNRTELLARFVSLQRSYHRRLFP
jgi:DNA-binding NarL/FixJ family response regulator